MYPPLMPDPLILAGALLMYLLLGEIPTLPHSVAWIGKGILVREFASFGLPRYIRLAPQPRRDVEIPLEALGVERIAYPSPGSP